MAITTLYVCRKDDPEARRLLNRFRKQGYSGLTDIVIERVFYLEGLDSKDEVQKLIPLFVNPVYETYSFESTLEPAEGEIIEIGYQKAIIDPETDSILEGAEALGVKSLEWVKLILRYQFNGIDREEAQKIVERELFDPIVQMIVEPDMIWDSLRPSGEPDKVRYISLKDLDDDGLEKLSKENSWYAPLPQLKAMQDYEEKRNRPFTDAEIEIFVQSWSDHCYHTTWKSLGLLKMLRSATEKINHPLVISIFADNAGGIEFFDDWVITIKGETHNFPSSISPFGGVATKHGGVIRDTMGFGKGGYPIGGSTIMGTMDPFIPESDIPTGALHPAYIVRESIRATAYYCNAMGIPMMQVAYKAHPGYPKCLALGHSIGIIPKKYALKDSPHPGDLVLLIGGRTGRDGLHGATASSAGMSGHSVKRESAAVQIGHPITERKIMEAVPVLRDRGYIRSITDLGAGGISSATGEMGEDTGVRLNLDEVKLKDNSLSAWEILLSESQERMLIALPPENIDAALSLLKDYHIETTIIGEFTGTKRFEAFWRGEKVVDIDMDFLWEACPIEPMVIEEKVRELKASSVPSLDSLQGVEEEFKRILSHYNCCDQSHSGFQFDSTVQGKTVIGPYSGVTGKMPTDIFLSAPLLGKEYGVMTTLAYNPFYGDISPEGLCRLMIIEAVSKAIAAGADPGAIALCDNFYTPKATPEVGWELTQMVKAISELSIKLGMPFISGKDSSSGTFTSKDGDVINVPYTFAVETLCRIPDVRKVVTKEFKGRGNSIIFLGRIDPERLGGSVYLDCHDERGDLLPELSEPYIEELQAIWKRLYELYNRPDNPIKAASIIGEGGTLRRIFEMCYGGQVGAKLDLTEREEAIRCGFFGSIDGLLFSEAIGSILLEIDAAADLEELFNDLPWFKLGMTVEGEDIELYKDREFVRLNMDDLIEAWESTFKKVVE